MTEPSGPLATNFEVVTFFITGTVVMAFLGWRFASSPAPVFRNFGFGLAWFSAALAIWSGIVWIQPQDLRLWTTLGVAVFLPGYLFFLRAAVQNWQPRNRHLALGAALVYLGVLFIVRTFMATSEPTFSERGLFYFNAQLIVLLFYIIAFVGAALPAVYAISRSISVPWLSRATLFCFNLVVICGVILLTSYDDDLQVYNGYLMGFGFLALLAMYLRQKPT